MWVAVCFGSEARERREREGESEQKSITVEELRRNVNFGTRVDNGEIRRAITAIYMQYAFVSVSTFI